MDKSKVFNRFSTELLNRLGKGNGNIVFSPLSIFAVLCMAAAGASGKTRQEILDAMGSRLTVEDLISVSEFLKESDDAVSTANALCVRYDAADSMEGDYLKLIRERFDAE